MPCGGVLHKKNGEMEEQICKQYFHGDQNEIEPTKAQLC